jgi:GAF domain-containing protein
MDDNLNLLSAQTARSLQQQNDRLQLLLKLTNSITANLELEEVLRAIAANIRQVMRCNAVNISLPGPEPGTFRLYAVDFPGGGGLLREEQVVTPGEDSPPRRAFETRKPVIWMPTDSPHGDYGREMATAEGIETVCFIPLVNRGRVLGIVALARATEDKFTHENIDSLSQAAGQIAVAVEHALAYQEISQQRWASIRRTDCGQLRRGKGEGDLSVRANCHDSGLAEGVYEAGNACRPSALRGVQLQVITVIAKISTEKPCSISGFCDCRFFSLSSFPKQTRSSPIPITSRSSMSPANRFSFAQ